MLGALVALRNPSPEGIGKVVAEKRYFRVVLLPSPQHLFPLRRGAFATPFIGEEVSEQCRDLASIQTKLGKGEDAQRRILAVRTQPPLAPRSQRLPRSQRMALYLYN